MPEYSLSVQRLPGDLEVLDLRPAEGGDSRPPVIVLHGLGSRKENMLPHLYALARRGLRALAFDAALHGGRPQAAERDALLGAAYLPTISAIIDQSVRDLVTVVDSLGLARVSLYGISLGAYIAYAAATQEPRVSAMAAAMGSPDWLGPLRLAGLGAGHPLFDSVAARSPLEILPSVLPPRPLLILHGEDDDIVPYPGDAALFQRLQPHYQASPDRLKFILTPGLGHQLTEEYQAEAVDWLAREWA